MRAAYKQAQQNAWSAKIVGLNTHTHARKQPHTHIHIHTHQHKHARIASLIVIGQTQQLKGCIYDGMMSCSMYANICVLLYVRNANES